MDAKYLAEIKARCEAVDSARRGEGGKSFGISCWKLKENALADIPALLAEVELSEKANAIGAKQNDELMDKLEDADQQIATLKRALILMGNDLADWMGNGTGEFWAKDYTAQAQEQEGKK